MALFLTGDIVIQSTTASWNQVEKELLTLGLKSYFVMGNHDNNLVGHAVFAKKHGGAYYSFIYKNELFVILNSTESDRSISKKQLDFLDNLISNTDAIAASYDRWENVTLLSSGMGEVKDENYLKVNVLPDTVTFQLIPLNERIEIKPVTWYNIPEKPDSITGPATVFPLQSGVGYHVSPVFNATSYRWNVTDGIFGESDSSQIKLRFNGEFKTGKVSVTAINNGFGESEPAILEIQSEFNTFIPLNQVKTKIEIVQQQNSILLNCYSFQSQKVMVNIFDLWGRVVFNEFLLLNPGINSKSIHKNVLGKGFLIVALQAEYELITSNIILF